MIYYVKYEPSLGYITDYSLEYDESQPDYLKIDLEKTYQKEIAHIRQKQYPKYMGIENSKSFVYEVYITDIQAKLREVVREDRLNLLLKNNEK